MLLHLIQMQNLGYREILQREFEARTAANARYSLRAFARDLGVGASQLSEIFNGRCGMSRKTAESLAKKLNLSPTECERFCTLVELEHARSERQKDIAAIKLKSLESAAQFQEIELEYFKVISDWYHLAILELTSLKDFEPTVRWCARALDLPEPVVSQAVVRLKRLGLLQDHKGTWIDTSELISTPNDIPSQTVRAFHKQILEAALRSLITDPVEDREFAALLFSMRKEDLPKAKTMLRNFRRKITTELTDTKEKDSLYCLALQLFEPKGSGSLLGKEIAPKGNA